MVRIVAFVAALFALAACEETAKGIERDLQEGGRAIDSML